MMSRLAILLGAGNAVLAILLGAFAAHAIENKLTARMQEIFNTAADYHLYHAIGLVLIGVLIHQHPKNKFLTAATYLMIFGIIVFCGSLYALSLSGITKFGMITPIGGLAFISAWLCVFMAFIKRP